MMKHMCIPRRLYSATEEQEAPPPRYRPDGLEALARRTNFSREELQTIYRGFKQECPNGIVREDTFKQIFSQFFPSGDSNLYAHHVFRSLDSDSTGTLNFEQFVEGLSMLSRGSSNEKLEWMFRLYDVDSDGHVSREDLAKIVVAVYELMGNNTDSPLASDPAGRAEVQSKHVDRILEKLDLDHDGVVGHDEFIAACLQDERIWRSLQVFDTRIS